MSELASNTIVNGNSNVNSMKKFQLSARAVTGAALVQSCLCEYLNVETRLNSVHLTSKSGRKAEATYVVECSDLSLEEEVRSKLSRKDLFEARVESALAEEKIEVQHQVADEKTAHAMSGLISTGHRDRDGDGEWDGPIYLISVSNSRPFLSPVCSLGPQDKKIVSVRIQKLGFKSKKRTIKINFEVVVGRGSGSAMNNSSATVTAQSDDVLGDDAVSKEFQVPRFVDDMTRPRGSLTGAAIFRESAVAVFSKQVMRMMLTEFGANDVVDWDKMTPSMATAILRKTTMMANNFQNDVVAKNYFL